MLAWVGDPGGACLQTLPPRLCCRMVIPGCPSKWWLLSSLPHHSNQPTTHTPPPPRLCCHAVIPGLMPQEMVAPVADSVGIRLLQKMGWRQGKGIGE